MTALDEPVAVLADTEAWAARARYPHVRFGGGPAFGVAQERLAGGWELHDCFGTLTPQDSRDSMGAHFRRLASEAERGGDRATHDECLRAAERLDWEAIDEATVLGIRYRVVRADRFIRTGPDGPEPPRPTDPDPGDDQGNRQLPDPATGFVVDPVNATGLSEGILKLELLEAIRAEGSVPPEVRADSAVATRTHPGGVLLPAAFMLGEMIGGEWGALDLNTSPTPQAARNNLVGYLRVAAPWQLGLSPADRAVYAAGADQVEAERANEVTVGDRRFRVVRVERLMRIGPDGPEGPRPSDPDPVPPVMVQSQQLCEQGVDIEADPDGPIELDEGAQRFRQLFREEEERLRQRRESC